ncbi:MAG: radical SAM protein [Rhodopseudomonas sp.]|uniref:B12-binding domain-containing radical SAM protein n=1 Tax=Rhodopseudomonas sp. TaxID=1078 RepID=UPI0018543DE0|nr:radical SAM protein [Rhodopseudomonas sp.]NVN86090.1 radical SAM protein [Rhodopseudomonas sp.]
MASSISSGDRTVFHFVIIKPTHYDDDGYPIQWVRSAIPSNTLACLNGLAQDVRDRYVLGPDVDIKIHTYDETNRRVRPDKIIEMIRADGGRAMIALVGVQSNQFPRAMDIARPFLAAKLPVCIGGFHVSGCIAMLPELPADIRAAQEMGIALFAGEAENHRLDEVVHDAYFGKMKPLYNYMDDLPSLEGEPIVILPREHVRRTAGSLSSVDLGRGCPYQCSFCTIINVQGRKSRFRSSDDLERIVRENYAQGVRRFFITDDNFARNKHWEELLDRLIGLRAEGMNIGFTIQVDTLCHKIPNFIEKATAAGVRRVFIGLENINPDNLLAANKRQNKITEYRLMLQKWREHGALTYAGYIIGFPGDTKESVKRDVEIIKRELPLDILEFFYLTPLPGSEDHKVLWTKKAWMDGDMNKYDLNHRVAHHSKMSDAEWEEAYKVAWETYYTPEHIRTILKRTAACKRGRLRVTRETILWFFLSYSYEGVHPLEAGIFRLKFRADRRYGMPKENPLLFYPRYVASSLYKGWKALRFLLQTNALLKELEAAPDRWTYTDLAIAPPRADEFEALELYHATAGGEDALARKRRDETIRENSNAARPVAPVRAASA